MNKSLFAVFACITVVFVGAGCTTSPASVTDPTGDASPSSPQEALPPPTLLSADSEGVAFVDMNVLRDRMLAFAQSSATEGDIMTLPFMYESEKMAEDLFGALYALHGVSVLEHLAQANASHKEAVVAVMEQLGVDQSVLSNPAGTFSNEKVQTLYDTLLKNGTEVRVTAYTVGLLAEETNIKTINTYLEKGIDGLSKVLFEALKDASGKNIRVLHNLLLDEGVPPYTPQVLSQDEFDALLR